MSYDERSHDAMFSRIMERMDTQEKTLDRIEAGVAKTNGRVDRLERWRDIVTAKVALVAGGVSCVIAAALWLLERIL